MSGPKKWGWVDQFEAQRGLCWICLKKMRACREEQHPLAPSFDHIVPLTRGGKGNWRNGLLAHKLCNSRRGAPYIWVKLSRFRRAAMQRIQDGVCTSTVEGIDLMGSNPEKGRKATGAMGRSAIPWLAGNPSNVAGPALRVTLGELVSLSESAQTVNGDSDG